MKLCIEAVSSQVGVWHAVRRMRFILHPSSFILLILFLVGCGSDTPVTPINGTGLPVAEEFVAYHEAHGGWRVFGHPITEAFRPSTDGPVVQYFQNMRLDYAVNGQQVRPYPLGAWAFPGLENVQPAVVRENGRSYTPSGSAYPIQDEFLAFYETYNGEALLGLPLSPQVDEGGLRVQYFQNGRLEWRPELPLTQRVQLGVLGQNHFDAEMVFSYRQEFARPISSAGIGSVRVEAALRYPVLYAGDRQILYVTVQTEDGRFVSDIQLTATIALAELSTELALGTTDDSGQIQRALDLSNIPPGMDVLITVTATRSDGQVVGQRTLGCRTWW